MTGVQTCALPISAKTFTFYIGRKFPFFGRRERNDHFSGTKGRIVLQKSQITPKVFRLSSDRVICILPLTFPNSKQIIQRKRQTAAYEVNLPIAAAFFLCHRPADNKKCSCLSPPKGAVSVNFYMPFRPYVQNEFALC